ncbi:uncharacterized protein LOC120331663 [Styela clava]|uniref:ras-like protein 1 n=1 Tax=Styela clava TaxID=7725 RepID=UPI0019399E2E|nr:ras-like protein 1 [Styela clava]XP_039254721.1 ras-like protein 1 [Styela clava]
MDSDSDDKTIKHSLRRNALGVTPSLPSPEKRLRMVVLGASGVGKSQLVSRFLGRPFTGAYLPTAEDFYRTKYIISGRTYQLDILDTAGHVLSPVMHNLTLLTGDLFLVVYSVADRGSWERAKDIVDSVEEVTRDPRRTNKCIERSFKNLLYANGGTSFQCDKFENGLQRRTKDQKQKMMPIPILIVGTKCDVENPQIQPYEIHEWLRQRPANAASLVEHIVASAKTDHNVQALFDKLFSMSCLPKELSPNMHRKVTENVYSINSSLADSTSHKIDGRPKSAEMREYQRRPRHSLTKKTSHLRTNPGCHSSGSSCCNSSSDSDDGPSTNAIATICSNQRRPSVDTEVLLAFSKVRTYSPEMKRKTVGVSTKDKLKKHMIKFKFS